MDTTLIGMLSGTALTPYYIEIDQLDTPRTVIQPGGSKKGSGSFFTTPVAMVGMTWHSGDMRQDRWALFLDVDGDYPTEPVLLRDKEEIMSFAAGCDLVRTNEIEQWNKKINTWTVIGDSENRT